MRRNTLVTIAALLVLATALYVLFGPSISGSISEYDDAGRLRRQLNGPLSPWTVARTGALLALLPPMAFAFMAMFAAWAGRAKRTGVLLCAALMLAYCLANVLSGGLGVLPAAAGIYFLPAGLLMFFAGLFGNTPESTAEEPLHDSV